MNANGPRNAVEVQKVVFTNKDLGLRLAGLLRLPRDFDLSRDYPAVVVTGPMLSVKEQAQSVYAEHLTELGYVTLVFDGSYFGQSEGELTYLNFMPRAFEEGAASSALMAPRDRDK